MSKIPIHIVQITCSRLPPWAHFVFSHACPMLMYLLLCSLHCIWTPAALTRWGRRRSGQDQGLTASLDELWVKLTEETLEDPPRFEELFWHSKGEWGFFFFLAENHFRGDTQIGGNNTRKPQLDGKTTLGESLYGASSSNKLLQTPLSRMKNGGKAGNGEA